MTVIISVLFCSIVLQLVAAGLAVRCIRVSGKRTAWIMIAIAVALALMVIRRLIPLFRAIEGDAANPDLLNEIVGMFLSLFMLVGIISVAPVLRERKQVENRLAESEERFRTTFEQAAVGIGHVALDGRWIRMNRKLCEIAGYTPEEMIRLKFQDITHPDDREADREASRRLLDGRLSEFSTEKRCIHKQGSVVWINLTVTLVRTSSGEPDYFIAVIRDLTVEKKAEEEIRILALRNEAILSSVPDIIMEVDSRKIYTWANRAGFEFFGDDVIGKEALAFFEGEQDTYTRVQPLFKGSEDTVYLESWQKRKDGEKRLLAWWCRVLKNSRGEVTGALSTARDITESRAVEERIKTELHEKQSLLREIHHRVKNNLQIVSSLLTLQSSRLPDPDLKTAFESCKNRIRSIGLVHERLYRSDRYSRIDFAEYTRAMLRELSFIFDSGRRISLEMLIEPVFINLDTAVPMGLILNELVTNAMKHAFPSGRRGTIRIGMKPAGGNLLTISVSDDGIGMGGNGRPPAEGFGMELIRILVKQVEGRMEFAKGAGTTCTITFPCHLEESTEVAL